MKKKFILLLVLLSSAVSFAQKNSAGKIYISDNKTDIGKAYTLGSDKSLNIVLDGLKAYNSLNLKSYLSYGSKEFYNEKGIAFQKNWFDSLSKVEEKPMLAFPLRIEGSKEDLVFMIAEENRLFKNGSKQKIYVFEINKLNQEGKITDFKQFQYIPESNEFGKTKGGRVYVANGDTTTLTFSNRGEVELVEKFKAAYNKMDGKACNEFFADSVTIWNDKGGVNRVSKNFWLNYFDNIQSVDWKISSTLPTKITDTDPVSGITIRSRLKTVLKDGTVNETSDIILFQYDLNGKIGTAAFWSKPILKK
ncbi:MAG: hypothetical protein EBT39_02960 [Sphingobacteriia bacterium]|jgi:hypothetical protein|nr:hypothetical protein [Candidatus Fonsibacter lacus]